MVDRKKIRSLRELKNLTTYELADKVETSQAMIAHIERGLKQPGIGLLKRIADFFGCKVDDLLSKEA